MAVATPQHSSPNTIQLAEMLSDLVSLRVCDPAAALALVSARPTSSPSTSTSTSHARNTSAITGSDITLDATTASEDADLKRAKDLVELHYEVREAHKKGHLKQGIDEAKGAVERAVRA